MLTKEHANILKQRLRRENERFPIMFAALGDPGRFRIFRLLMENHDICVTDVADVMGITVSAASQQLKILEMVGLARKMRMGQMVCYEINNENQIAKQLIKLLNYA